MKKVISVQPHVVERRDVERRSAASVSANLDQLRGAGILVEGPSFTIAVGRKDGASVLPDPQNPGHPVGIKAGAFFHSNPQKDTLFVSTNLVDKTGQRVVWTVPMPSGFQLEDVKLGPSSKTVYLVLKNLSEGRDHIYSMDYNGVSAPQPTSITGTKLRWLRSDGVRSDLNYMIEDDTRLRVFNPTGNLTDTGVSVECGTHISLKSAPYTTLNREGVYLGLPEKNAVVFIPQSKLASLSPGAHPLFQNGTQDVCNLSADLTGATVFKFGDGSAAGTSIGVYNLGPTSADSTLLVGQPGLHQVAFLNNVQNGLCNSVPPSLTMHGPDGFGTLIGPSINVNDHYSSVTRAEMLPIGAFSALEESINLIPLNELKVILAQGGNVSVSLFDTVKIVGNGLGTGSYVNTESDSIGSHGTNNLVMVIPVDPTKQAMNLIFENSVEGVNSSFVLMVQKISNGEFVPTRSAPVIATPIATSQNPITDLPTQNVLTSASSSSSKASSPSTTTNTVLASVTSATLALTTSAFQQITNNTETETSSGSSSSGGLSLPYLLIIVGVGIIILVLLVIAAKVTRSHRNATGPRDAENPSPTLTQIRNPVFGLHVDPEEGPQYEDIDKFRPPVPTSARPIQQGDNPYLLPTPLQKGGPVSNPTYDRAMPESEADLIVYDFATMPNDGEDPLSSNGGYLHVES